VVITLAAEGVSMAIMPFVTGVLLAFVAKSRWQEKRSSPILS